MPSLELMCTHNPEGKEVSSRSTPWETKSFSFLETLENVSLGLIRSEFITMVRKIGYSAWLKGLGVYFFNIVVENIEEYLQSRMWDQLPKRESGICANKQTNKLTDKCQPKYTPSTHDCKLSKDSDHILFIVLYFVARRLI